MSDWIPVTCPCGKAYDAGDLLACPECRTPSSRATPTAYTPDPSGIHLDKCSCGRVYNRGRLASCPACGEVNRQWSAPPASVGTSPGNEQASEGKKRWRKWLAFGIPGAVLIVTAGAMLFASMRDSPPPAELDVQTVRDRLQSSGVACEEADVSRVSTLTRSVDIYECVVAGQSFALTMEVGSTENSLAREFDVRCAVTDRFAYVIGANWFADTSTPLFTLDDIQDLFGGAVVTGGELCPVVQRVYYPEDYSQWNTIYSQFKWDR